MSRPARDPCQGAMPAGWTGADEAELAVLIHFFVEESWIHVDAGCCEACLSGTGCAALEDAWQIVQDWYEARWRLSLAEWLRALEDRRRDAAA